MNPTDFDPAFLDYMIDDLMSAIPAGSGDPAPRRAMVRAAVLALRPADAFQAMLAVQAVAAHYAVMDAFRQAAEPELDAKAAARQRSNAAGIARMMQASLRALKARQAALAEARPAPESPLPAPGPIAAPAGATADRAALAVAALARSAGSLAR